MIIDKTFMVKSIFKQVNSKHSYSSPRLSLYIILFLVYAPSSTSSKKADIAFNLHSQIHKLLRRIMKHKEIRIQSAPDPCVENISTIEDIRSKIAEVRDIQGKFRDSTLYERKWKSINEVGGEVGDSSCSLKLLQFNTLAQGLSSGPTSEKPNGSYGGFTNIPNPEIILDFDLRCWRLMEVLLEDDYDIIALEEVDRFHGYFEPLLSKLGYDGSFTPKPCAPGVFMGWYSDGCALFWKRGVLKVLKEEKQLYKVGSQVYTITTMRHLATGRILVLAVTHLKAKKGLEDVRISQVEELLAAIRTSAENAAELKNLPSGVPVIVAGDFNSDFRDDLSCIHKILSGDSVCPLKSAYDLDLNSDSSFYTTWKTRGSLTVKRVIDYILHNADSTKGFECSHILEIPADSKVEETRFPGFKYPSDHLAIGAKFNIQ